MHAQRMLNVEQCQKVVENSQNGIIGLFCQATSLDTNTKVSQKLIGTDEEEMVMIKQQVSPLCMTHIQLLNSQSIVDIPHMESSLSHSSSVVGFTKKQAELRLVANKLKIDEVPWNRKDGVLHSNQLKLEPNATLAGFGNSC